MIGHTFSYNYLLTDEFWRNFTSVQCLGLGNMPKHRRDYARNSDAIFHASLYFAVMVFMLTVIARQFGFA